MKALQTLRRLDWHLVLVVATLGYVGCLFIHSATQDDVRFAHLAFKQALFLCIAGILGLVIVLVPYPRIMRRAWWLYVIAVTGLLLLPWLGVTINGATRWFRLPGFMVQPSEIAKLGLILALAAWLRFRHNASAFDGLLVPVMITAVPAVLVMRQPDLGSSLVFWPVLLAMCWVAGSSGRSLLILVVLGVVGLIAAYAFGMHEYQQHRVHAWLEHFTWDQVAVEHDPAVREFLQGQAYQPWQSLIAIGSGGLSGFGIGEGPQSRYDFLPYRFDDYVFSVVAEETGLLGAAALIGLYSVLILGLLLIALRTRERFGRLVVVGVAAMLGTQALVHTAVCSWMVPATGLPLPLVSYGGSATLSAGIAVALALNVGARKEPVLGADGFA